MAKNGGMSNHSSFYILGFSTSDSVSVVDRDTTYKAIMDAITSKVETDI